MKFVGILFVAILGVLGLDVEGMQAPVLDFDNIFTLGQQIPEAFKTERKNKGLYFKVVNPSNKKINICFYVDGRQPSILDAVTLSCAKEQDTAVTDWYMKMFGVIDKDGKDSDIDDNYIKAGVNEKNQIVRIVDISKLPKQDERKDLPRKYDSSRDAFIQNFRKIASNPVGRTLLYRILIEIRRKLNGEGYVEVNKNIEKPNIIGKKRNNCRYLEVIWNTKGNAFSFHKRIIKFGVQYPPIDPTTVGKLQDDKYYEIILYSRPDDVGLLHELIHWYHFLRDPKRYAKEYNAENGAVKIYGKKLGEEGIAIPIGSYYWPQQELSDKWRWSAVPWVVLCGNNLVVDFEEIRTILGSHTSISKYLAGDDISENLYRSCIGEPLRFGHAGVAFYEDKSVIDKVYSTCNVVSPLYDAPEPHNATNYDVEGGPIFKYSSDILNQGIGRFKIHKLGVELILPN